MDFRLWASCVEYITHPYIPEGGGGILLVRAKPVFSESVLFCALPGWRLAS